ncbi:MAG: 50S ribosomal protein L30 [Candidatus Micrarchaeota archaeon]
MEAKRIAVVRVRGSVGVYRKLNDTMRMLGLTRVNHCVVVKEAQLGMVKKCKDYLTWGEIDEETFTMLIIKRALKKGNKRLTPDDIEKAGFKSANEFAGKFMKSESTFDSLEVKKVFRLHPPRKGYVHIKKPYPHGALGYRKGKINDLLKRMM